MADLGVEARFQASPVPQTILYDASIALDYFEFDSRDTGLWEMRERSRDRIAAFVDAIADRWRADVPAAGDLEARAAVEARCAEAYEKIQMGDYQAAKQILATAAERNGAARSPLVYQYVANVAVLTGEPFVAVSAQKEALRLAPDNELYRRNLTSVLAASYKQARTPMKTLPGEP